MDGADRGRAPRRRAQAISVLGRTPSREFEAVLAKIFLSGAHLEQLSLESPATGSLVYIELLPFGWTWPIELKGVVAQRCQGGIEIQFLSIPQGLEVLMRELD